jgi:hypothetical protein
MVTQVSISPDCDSSHGAAYLDSLDTRCFAGHHSRRYRLTNRCASADHNPPPHNRHRGLSYNGRQQGSAEGPSACTSRTGVGVLGGRERLVTVEQNRLLCL